MIDKQILIDRFNAHTIASENNDCKLWSQSGDWYGTFRIGKKLVKAHRAAYILFVGEIPSGMHVCHTCDVKNCVNPKHLFIGTHKDNMLDMHAKGRWRTGNFGDHLKLSQALADVIYADSRSHQKIADHYGISRTLVSGIKNHKNWNGNREISKEEKQRFRDMAERL